MENTLDKIIEHLPEILKAASEDLYSMIAFFVVIIAIIALIFFRKENVKVKVGIFIVLLSGLAYLIYFLIKESEKFKYEKSTTLKFSYIDKTPKIIGIYPNNIFGINQKKGLIKSLRDSSNDIEIIHLDFLTYNQMKSEKIDVLLNRLSHFLETENVIAIAGPPITEIADDVIELLKLKKSKVPIFNTSAAPKEFLQWTDNSKTMNLYRIGTGTDDRASSLAGFLKKHTKDLRKTAILIETNKNGKKTYGEVFYDEIIKASPEFITFERSEHIKKYFFDRSNIKQYDSLFNSIKFDYNAILFLGVGDFYNFTIDKYYKGNYSSNKLAKFGGYMFGYALNGELEKLTSEIVNNRIFEITDLDLSRSGFDSSINVRKFMSEFGGFHPGLRDEASYYDIGLCLSQALVKMGDKLSNSDSEYLKFDNDGLTYLNEILKRYRFNAVSSEIKFDNLGLNSKNVLSTAIYDSISNKWKSVNRDQIMKME